MRVTRKPLALGVLAAVAVAAVAAAFITSMGSKAAEPPAMPAVPVERPLAVPPDAAQLSVSNDALSRPIPPGFLSLSLEFRAVEEYAGTDPAAPNPVLEQLIRNLAPDQSPALRIGGDSTDRTWWPVPHVRRPPGVSYALGPRWLQVTRALARGVGARLVLGINLEADRRAVARAEALAFTAGFGRQRILALELGNEPDLYSSFGWYRTASGLKVPGRPARYGFASYIRDFSRISAALGGAPLAGPATGSRRWVSRTPRFLAAEPGLAMLTLHRYPLQRCYMPAASRRFPTVPNLLSAHASHDLAQGIARYTALAHRQGNAVRVDELNSVSCGGAPGVSDAFAAALWALDTLFEMARVGVDGVNVHTFPGAAYQPFTFKRVDGTWTASVKPVYYGLLAFARAVPPGSRLLRVGGTGSAHLRVWATRVTDGTIRVTLINDSPSRARVVAIRVPGASGLATVGRLRASGLWARGGVTLAGKSFDPRTDSGLLAGPDTNVLLAPTRGVYVVRVPDASAALLTVRQNRPRGTG